MPLTKQELLIPRVLCIGGKDGDPNYPGSRFMTGDIIEKNGRDYWSVKADAWLNQTTVEKFPHLFRPMPWWEGRKVEEMPQYLKAKKTGVVRKVLSYTRNPEGAVDFAGEDFPTSLEWFAPADEAEYQEYQKQKEA